MKKFLIVSAILFFSTSSITVQGGGTHSSGNETDTCGLESRSYRVEESDGGNHSSVGADVQLTVHSGEDPGWEMSGPDLTASGKFHLFADDCDRLVLYGTASYPTEECVHAIFLFGANNWDDIYATFIDTQLNAECHEYSSEPDIQGFATAEQIRIFGHNGQIHFVKPTAE